MAERVARAKINLALHVTGQRTDGYHLLDSLVVFAEAGDRIFVDKPHHAHGPVTFSVSGPFSEGLDAGPGNLVSAATFMLREAAKSRGFDPAPVDIHLEKNLPLASGIGGGSADAATTLLMLKEAWELDLDLMPIAKILGADVPMCLKANPQRAQGIGDELSDLNHLPAIDMVLVNPGKAVSTPEIFKALAAKNNQPMVFDEEEPLMDVLKNSRNDLQEPAISLVPEISDCLTSLDNAGAILSRMSGSGATCFGIFESSDAATEAAKTLSTQNPDWWCIATRTFPS